MPDPMRKPKRPPMTLPGVRLHPGQPLATLTTRQVAMHLSLSVTTVQAMAERGELSAWRTGGGHRRISLDSVESWAARRGLYDHEPNPVTVAPMAPSAPPAVLFAGLGDDGGKLVAALAGFDDGQRAHFHHAVDGLDALLLAERVRPQILIAAADLQPIGTSALIDRLRSYPQFSRMLAVVLTPADGMPGHLAGSRRSGCVCWPCPIAVDRLTGLIQALLLAPKA